MKNHQVLIYPSKEWLVNSDLVKSRLVRQDYVLKSFWFSLLAAFGSCGISFVMYKRDLILPRIIAQACCLLTHLYGDLAFMLANIEQSIQIYCYNMAVEQWHGCGLGGDNDHIRIKVLFPKSLSWIWYEFFPVVIPEEVFPLRVSKTTQDI